MSILDGQRSEMKVIGFDSWTGGASHYQRLVGPFKERGIDLSLVHLGSWGSDPGRPAIEQIGTLPVRDIRAFSSRGFAEILEAERPAAVIFLSTDTFAHRAFNRYCRQRGIPTVNAFHGLITVQSTGGVRYKVNVGAQARFVARRLVKALTVVWPTYALALWRTKATSADWKRFATDIVALARGRFPEVSARDSQTDKCCVFAAADTDYAMHRYGFAREDVVAVGNPDLLKVGLTTDSIGSHLSGAVDRTDVMYIDTGLVQTGFVFDSQDEFIRHMIQTRDALERQGKGFVFKPHPSHLGSPVVSALAEARIEICGNEGFVSRLQSCCACIVEPSTLAVIPALMGMPMFLASYGKLSGQPYGKVLTGYPRAMVLEDLADFTRQAEREQASLDLDRTSSWIAENAGPLPAAEMPNRVVDVVVELIERAQPANGSR